MMELAQPAPLPIGRADGQQTSRSQPAAPQSAASALAAHGPVVLSRIHSLTKSSVSMRDSDVARVVKQAETLLLGDFFRTVPALAREATSDGWLPIASLLNYSTLGQLVWSFGGVGVVADCVRQVGSMLLEISSDGSSIRKVPPRVALRNQLEFLFSDGNYCKDVHLQLLQERDGFVPVEALINSYQQLGPHEFRSAAGIEKQIELVAEALESSVELKLRPPTPAGPPCAVRKLSLVEKITAQVEWYLCSSKFATDRFLFEQARDHNGWVPVATLLSFPRMRKLCHPQVGAVAHVLSLSPKLQVSEDKTLVRPLMGPPASPAYERSPAGLKKKIKAVVEKLLNDASLVFDRAMQTAIVQSSPPTALLPGGLGVRVPLAQLMLRAQVQNLARTEAELCAILPVKDESSLVRLSDDGLFLERLVPTPEVRQLFPERSDTADFSVLSFNLLAEMLTTLEQFPAIEQSVLAWTYRRELIRKEIAYHSPSILCLQELQGTPGGVGTDDHYAYFKTELGELGYSSRYARKIRRDGTEFMGTQIGNGVFWREDEFEYIEHEVIPIAQRLCDACDDEPSKAHFGRGSQVALIVGLRHRALKRPLVVLCTHLSCNFQEPWAQVAQAFVAVRSAMAFAVKFGDATPVVMGADLNSIPGSGVHRLLTTSRLSAEHRDMAIVGENVAMPFLRGKAELRLPAALHSAYKTVLGDDPLFTNFAGPPSNFVGTLDYLMCDSHLRPLQVLLLPSEDTVRLERCLPSSRFPSDHLPLLAQFGFKSGASAATSRQPHAKAPAPAMTTVGSRPTPAQLLTSDVKPHVISRPPVTRNRDVSLVCDARVASSEDVTMVRIDSLEPMSVENVMASKPTLNDLRSPKRDRDGALIQHLPHRALIAEDVAANAAAKATAAATAAADAHAGAKSTSSGASSTTPPTDGYARPAPAQWAAIVGAKAHAAPHASPVHAQPRTQQPPHAMQSHVNTPPQPLAKPKLLPPELQLASRTPTSSPSLRATSADRTPPPAVPPLPPRPMPHGHSAELNEESAQQYKTTPHPASRGARRSKERASRRSRGSQ